MHFENNLNILQPQVQHSSRLACTDAARSASWNHAARWTCWSCASISWRHHLAGSMYLIQKLWYVEQFLVSSLITVSLRSGIQGKVHWDSSRGSASIQAMASKSSISCTQSREGMAVHSAHSPSHSLCTYVTNNDYLTIALRARSMSSGRQMCKVTKRGCTPR